jgi:anti-sigma28 factor (negative regulator of flagellin synthesis)
MSNIQGINGSRQLGIVKPPAIAPNKKTDSGYTTQATTDEVEISQTAQLLSKVAAIPDIRQGKVQDVKNALADNTYDLDTKLPQAIDSLLDEYA